MMRCRRSQQAAADIPEVTTTGTRAELSRCAREVVNFSSAQLFFGAFGVRSGRGKSFGVFSNHVFHCARSTCHTAPLLCRRLPTRLFGLAHVHVTPAVRSHGAPRTTCVELIICSQPHACQDIDLLNFVVYAAAACPALAVVEALGGNTQDVLLSVVKKTLR